MSQEKKTRTRAVALTEEGSRCLKQKLDEIWAGSPTVTKLTREVRADLLGLSVVTSDRVMKGEAVDRNSLRIAFKSVGLTWHDSFCISAPLKKEKGFDSKENLIHQTPFQEVAIDILPRRSVSPWIFVCSLTLVSVALLLTSYISNPSPMDKVRQLHDEYSRVEHEFHDGKLDLASSALPTLLKRSQSSDSAAALAEGFRLKGDILEAHGQFAEAKRSYESDLSIREALYHEKSKPPLWEAIGVVDTRLGNLSQANMFLTKALNGYQSFGDNVGVSMSCRDLGTVAFLNRAFDLSLSWFDRADKAVSREHKPDLKMDIIARRALVYRDQGSLQKAKEILNTCLAYWKNRNHLRWIAVTESQLASVETQLGHLRKAKALYASSSNLFVKVGDQAGYFEANQTVHKLARQGRASRFAYNGF